MISFFIICLAFGLSKGMDSRNNTNDTFDWCPIVKPNGHYNGLGIYRYFKKPPMSTYVMYNRAGFEWDLQMDNRLDPKNMTIRYTRDKLRIVDDNGLGLRFGTFMRYIDEELGRFEFHFINCNIYQMGEGQHHTNCSHIIGGRSKETVYLTKEEFVALMNVPKFKEFVVMKLSPSKKGIFDEGKYILFINKNNRNDYSLYDPLTNNTEQTQPPNPTKYSIPKFVTQMSDSLFKKIDGVLDYSFAGNKSGWIVLFNIDGRPKYCITEENQNISDGCKSAENMKTLFDDCFTKVVVTPETSSDSKVWILIVAIVVIILFIIIIVIIILYRKRGKWQRKPGIPFPTVSSPTASSVSSFNSSKFSKTKTSKIKT